MSSRVLRGSGRLASGRDWRLLCPRLLLMFVASGQAGQGPNVT